MFFYQRNQPLQIIKHVRQLDKGKLQNASQWTNRGDTCRENVKARYNLTFASWTFSKIFPSVIYTIFAVFLFALQLTISTQFN